MGPLLKTGKILLYVIASSCLLTELLRLVSPEQLLSALNLAFNVINKDIEQPYTDPWGTPYITGLHLDIEPLTTALCIWPIQIIPYASDSLSTKYLSQWFSDKHVVWDCVNGLSEVKTDGISCFFLIHQYSHSIAESHQLCQA